MHRKQETMIINSPLALRMTNLFMRLDDLILPPVHVKLEGYNIAGSIKIKPALKMINALEEQGRIKPGSAIIESSSGNLGTALAIVCAEKGYRFTCVTDPMSSESNRQLIQAYGGKVIVVQERDPNGGYLQTRLRLIHDMLKADHNLVWINQYANPDNFSAHMETTAPEILKSFPQVDWLFIGAGTTGTLMGCIRYFREYSPDTKIIALDTEGSVTFGGPPKKRHIPGLGTSRKPEIAQTEEVAEVRLIPEADTIRMCHYYAKKGYLLGGSTGTVLAGVASYKAEVSANASVVAISPDLGERYLNTIYNPEWIQKHFGETLYDEIYNDKAIDYEY